MNSNPALSVVVVFHNMAREAPRCLAASAVGVPSIVSPTPPLREAVDNGKSGLVARDAMERESALDRLIANSHFRNETGRKAKAVRWRFPTFRNGVCKRA